MARPEHDVKLFVCFQSSRSTCQTVSSNRSSSGWCLRFRIVELVILTSATVARRAIVEEWVPQHTMEQITDVPVPQFGREILQVVQIFSRRSASRSAFHSS